MEHLAQNVLNPEQYINTLSQQAVPLIVHPTAAAVLTFTGSGTVQALQLKLSKQYDPRQLELKVQYENEIGINLPLLAFFGEPDQVSLHHSSPIGLMDTGDAYLFYSNLPMPYQNGMRIGLYTQGTADIPLTVQVAATTASVFSTQLRVIYKPSEMLQAFGPDFTVDVPGNGKLVGLVLVTKDQQYAKVPMVVDKKTGQQASDKIKWPMGYLEGNLTLSDGTGVTRYYSGQEDWAESGYYFNSGYQLPPGGGNRPFAGVLRYAGGVDGYATLFRYFSDLSAFRFEDGLRLAFQHGTWQNNFPVTYGATVFYYSEVPGMTATVLPSSGQLPAQSSLKSTSSGQ